MRCKCVNGLPSQPDATADGRLNDFLDIVFYTPRCLATSNLLHEKITDLANSPNVAKTGSLKGISHTDRRLEVRAVKWQCFKESSLEGRPREPAQYRGNRVAQCVLPNAFVLDFDILILKLDISSLDMAVKNIDSDRQGRRS
ncbi:hypothetical protein EV715DRAFT_291867 [Schizophyllum commune]